IRLNGTKIQIKTLGLHVDEVFVTPGVKLTKLLSEGLKSKNIERFYLEGTSRNLSTASGNTLYYDLKWFGLLTLFLMAVGLLYSYGKRDYTLVFMEASIINLYLFALGFSAGSVNLYYYSKAMYAFIYPVTLYAIIGIEELLSRMDSIQKKTAIVLVIMLLMTTYSMHLLNKDSVGILIGERKDLYESVAYWPLLEYNRFLRYWDMMYGIKRSDYGFVGWLQMLNETSAKKAE
ncbi:MAG: hypothetical protein V1703_00730, partial [Candidatus Altiarchaeota archaeon]